MSGTNLWEDLKCPISKELMVDPVVAADGHTYEQQCIEQWLELRGTSPFTREQLPIDILVFENRAMKHVIELLVKSGKLDGVLCADWRCRKYMSSPEYAQKLFDEGKVEEAAKLGHAEAQGMMAVWCCDGSHGLTKDRAKMVRWAKKAAVGGDMTGQYLLGYAYHTHAGDLKKDLAKAKEWYEKAAVRGDVRCMLALGVLYSTGGRGLAQDYVAAVGWFRKGAEAGCEFSQYHLGRCYYNGQGVTEDLVQARTWLQKSVDQNFAAGQCVLGSMMVKGEGGERDLNAGVEFWKKAAAQGNIEAQTNLQNMNACLAEATFIVFS